MKYIKTFTINKVKVVKIYKEILFQKFCLDLLLYLISLQKARQTNKAEINKTKYKNIAV